MRSVWAARPVTEGRKGPTDFSGGGDRQGRRLCILRKAPFDLEQGGDLLTRAFSPCLQAQNGCWKTSEAGCRATGRISSRCSGAVMPWLRPSTRPVSPRWAPPGSPLRTCSIGNKGLVLTDARPGGASRAGKVGVPREDPALPQRAEADAGDAPLHVCS